GTMVRPRTRMGEGFVSNKYPSPIIARGSIEPPSPARGEGTITATALALRSRCQTAHLVPAAHFCVRALQLRFTHPASPGVRCARPDAWGGRIAEKLSGAAAPVGLSIAR